MSINSNYNSSSLTAVGQFTSNDPVSGRANLKGAFAALGSALRSGDLGGAQKAFTQIQNAHKSHGHHQRSGGIDADGDNDGSKSAKGAKSAFATDFKALSDALSSNNLSAAQQAWTKLQNDRKNFGGFGASPTNQPSAPAESTSSDTHLNVSA